MCFSAILLHGIGRVVFGASDSYGGPGPTPSHLPPFFGEAFGRMQWLGPVMPAECDPLRERIRALETVRKG